MRKIALSATILGTILVPLLQASPAQAQATRTWVSGVGDDINPCSRTAPCKTFAGAISKTATGGEINCLDPGGFGAVTITKSITIDCRGTFASILASGTNGVVVNVTEGSVVKLRNLWINGTGTGLNGIQSINGAGRIHVDNVLISGFRMKDIDIASTSTAEVYSSNTRVFEIGGKMLPNSTIFAQPTGWSVVLGAIMAGRNIKGAVIEQVLSTDVSTSVSRTKAAERVMSEAPPLVLQPWSTLQETFAEQGREGILRVVQGTAWVRT
jgi:hypothetical protein